MDTSAVTAAKRPRAETKRLKPAEPFDTCSECGCNQGFHIVPARARRGLKSDHVALLLKCPDCGALHDAGLTAPTR